MRRGRVLLQKALMGSLLGLFVLGGGLMSAPRNIFAEPEPVERDLVLFGPAAAGLIAAGFNPQGKATAIPLEEEIGVDKAQLKIEGLPANTCFTVFLTENNAPPFGSVQYIAEVCTNEEGKGKVKVATIVFEAFALKTGAANAVLVGPTPLKHIVLWFADSEADNAFTGAPATPFDADGDAGVAVLHTTVPLP